VSGFRLRSSNTGTVQQGRGCGPDGVAIRPGSGRARDFVKGSG
jgi:hypothetical protein